MRILRELWTKEVNDPEVHTTYQYIVDLKERLESTCTMAKENLKKATQPEKGNETVPRQLQQTCEEERYESG